ATRERWDREGRFHGLNSTYHAKWYSPQAGLRGEMGITEKASLFGQYTFLYPLRFTAKAHWNLGMQHHFSHYNKAFRSFGSIATLGSQYRCTDRLSIKVEVEYLYLRARGGRSTIHHNSPIRDAKRIASEVRCSLVYAF
ncbi:MAG: hypothetical protein JSR46_12370, partial [Verrucomicrobia bacterium]|nr:hypothetical protein [Verrucomicrobiota bacterium]